MSISELRSFGAQANDTVDDNAQATLIAIQAKKLVEVCNAFIAQNDKISSSEAPFDQGIRKWSGDALQNFRNSDDPAVLAARAKRLYQERRVREQFFLGSDIFGEPAWDILLDLMIAKCLGKKISITSSCIASSVPPTTALRWIAVLEESGFVSRTSDASDRRRAFLKLTNSAYLMMSNYLKKIGD